MTETPCWYCEHHAGLDGSRRHGLCTHPQCSRVQADPAGGCCSWSRVPGVDDEPWAPAGYQAPPRGVAWRAMMPAQD